MIHLITSYFTAKEPDRKKELDTCLLSVINSGLFASVTVLVDEYPVKLYEGCNIVYIHNRPMFDTFFHFCKPNAWNVISNSDIYFDETIQLIEKRDKQEFIALTRYDVDKQGRSTFFNRRDSQDTWCIFGKPREALKGEFYLGIPGCDNVIARIAKQAGYKITNPSLTIRTYHLHNSAVRTYTPKDKLPPPYELITPHK